jgi:hypothetical protein
MKVANINPYVISELHLVPLMTASYMSTSNDVVKMTLLWTASLYSK